MPIIKSAKKRVRTAQKQRVNNLRTKRTLREKLKNFAGVVSTKKDASTAQADAFSAIDTAVKKGVMSKNKAARQKKQLNAASKAAGGVKAGSAPKKKAVAKKPAASTAKPKAAAKKPAAKKPAAKKAAPKKKPAAKK